MPITPTYPGVYVEELPSGVRTLTGVATSVAAFLGYFSRGPLDEAVRIFSFGDFEREFGALRADSEAGYAIRQFFLNGGGQAWVVRTAAGVDATDAVMTLADDGGADALVLTAVEPGAWANDLRYEVDYDATDPATQFNLRIFRGDATAPEEDYADVTVASAEGDIDGVSALVGASMVGGARPAQTGTTGGDISGLDPTTLSDDSVNVFLDGTQVGSFDWGGGTLTTLSPGVRDRLQARLQALAPLASATVQFLDGRLRILPNTGDDEAVVTLEDDSGTLVADIGLAPGTAVANPQRFTPTPGVDAEPSAAAVDLQDAAGGTPVLRVSASSEGAWGNDLVVDVDHAVLDPAGDPDTLFNLRIAEMGEVGGRRGVVREETWTGLLIEEGSARHVTDVLDGSDLASVALVGTPADGTRPAQTGTVSSAFGGGGGEIDLDTYAGGETMRVSLDGGATVAEVSLAAGSFTAASLASALQAAIRAADARFARATVELLGSGATRRFLQVKAGTDDPSDVLTFRDDPGDALAASLGLDVAARTNVQAYALGATAAAGAQSLPDGFPLRGYDGQLPDSDALIGDRGAKTGMYALLDVDLFNILCVPDTMRLSDAEAALVAAEATALCGEERAFYIVDVPQGANPRDEPDEIQEWLDGNAGLRDKNAALYYPRPRVADPLNEFRPRAIASSGTMAGIYARTDAARGVWKAPAGTEASLRGVQGLEYRLTDPENGVLNPLGINALRNRPVVGTVAWGARTLFGADSMASEWKYVPVRRTALFIEESLFRGTQWVVFEPNDEKLWSQIRLNVGTFMNTLFRQGAFQGTTPAEAYFVKCDAEVNPQADIDRGIVNIVVGFAPLKPAEFVLVKLQQMAGQSDA